MAAHVPNEDRSRGPGAELIQRRVLAQPVEIVAGDRGARGHHPVDVELIRPQQKVALEMRHLIVTKEARLQLGENLLDRPALVAHGARRPLYSAVEVTVPQARHQDPAMQIDDLGPRTDATLRAPVVADERDASVLDGYRLRPADAV